MTFPPLYHKGKTGATWEWKIWTEGDKIYTEYGIVGGAKQLACKKAEPKNVGRANETTAEGQAMSEAASMHKFKLDRKYSLTPEEAQESVFLPMLAHDFDKYGKKVSYPVFVQPKLDGCRALACWKNNKIVLLSRSGKEYNVPHIQEELAKYIPEDLVLDGELYIHGVGFQSLVKLIKKNRPESIQLTYCVYDCFVIGEEEATWEDRYMKLTNYHDMFASSAYIRFVPTNLAQDLNHIKSYQKDYIGKGYEGAIVRCGDGVYELGYRSQKLLKVKLWQDKEFKITGFTNGVGKFEKCVIWECVAENGLKFNVTPKGTASEREEWLRDAPSYIGQMLKVKFFERTDDGLPRFPVGLGVRPEEDMDAKKV
jgi:ATP-dependent DNA ligase